MARMLGEQDMDEVALGAAFLGTGGGGDPYVGKLMAKAALRASGPIKLVQPHEIPDDALCVHIAMMGAPTVMVEKLPNGLEALHALHQLEMQLGRKADYIVPIEVGGLNSTIPIAAAAETGLPLVDGDAMGRAFPEIQMVTLTMHGLEATPMALADDKGNSSAINANDNLTAERLARAHVVQMGGSALAALYPVSGAALKKAILPNTMTLAQDIGKTIMEERRANCTPGSLIAKNYGAIPLFSGRLVDIERRTTGGFARGTAQFKGIDEYAGEDFSIEFQNEFLLARHSMQAILASAPDLICALDADGGLPVTTEQLRYGLAVSFIGLPAHKAWREPAGIALAGPRYFGYEIDYTPIEELIGARNCPWSAHLAVIGL